jgi:SpoIVB peptidase S55
MTGEALTVFQGTKPEPFKVRVISIMRQFLPKQDVILIRAEDPRVEFAGIVAGMSGSPVYIDGKLVGAIAYAWSFSKQPFGGVTPIESMLAERARPRRLNNDLVAETGADGIRTLTMAEGGRAFASGFAEPFQPASGATPPRQGEGRLVPVAIPLSVAGLDPRLLNDLTGELRASGLVPIQAGGGRKHGDRASPGAGRVEPGSAIGVELIRGDMSMVGVGTVTYVDRDGMLAFGHPLFGVGEIYLPLVDAEIHAILPSLAQSMKLSSPLHEVGALIQDRQSCIVGDLGARTTMVPISVSVTGPGGEHHSFRAEVARNRRLTPMFASLVVSNALLEAEPESADMVVTVLSKVNLKGRRPLELRDEIFAPEGVSRQSLNGSRGLRALGDLLSNPFEPVVLDRLDFDVRVEFRRDVTEIVGVSLTGAAIRPGQTVPLRVTLRPYDGPEYVETIPIAIPRGLAGDVAHIEIASGTTAKPDMPQAESLAIYLDNLGRYFPPSSIVVSVQTLDDGATLRGQIIPDLPSAASDTLRPGNQTRRADSYRVTDRTIFPTKHLVFGKQEISVYVRDGVLRTGILDDAKAVSR